MCVIPNKCKSNHIKFVFVFTLLSYFSQLVFNQGHTLGLGLIVAVPSCYLCSLMTF